MSNNRDTRTHDERIKALWTTFGECKQAAIQSGLVNDCSLNKVCAKAKVPKNYVTGVRKLKDEEITKRYMEVNESIQEWRGLFQQNRTLSDDQKLINVLTEENNNLKASVEPLLEKIDLLENAKNDTANQTSNKDDEIFILREQLRQAQLNHNHDGKVKEFGIASSIARRIISPDFYRKKRNKYVFGDAVFNQQAINDAYHELDIALSRSLKMRLYVLVGLPCSGKSTWAEQSQLCPDRHPVIFDATNLTIVDRLQLVHQVRLYKDLPITCVFLDTPMTKVRNRNLHKRTSDRQIPGDVLEGMNQKMEKPNPYEEKWIDELIVVRTDG